MKIAYLIQCHKSAEQINELIKRLSADTEEYNTDFYIHVDAKSDICDKIITAENIILLKKRVNVKWGHISQVEATLELMSTAVNANKGYDYLWLISGQDYPIKSNKYIADFLKEHKGENFIEILPDSNKEYQRYLKRNQTWYSTWGASPLLVIRILRKVYNIITGGAYRSIIKRKNILNVKWQFGSSWWTLTEDTCRYIISAQEDGRFLRYYKNCICPDESFFQTLLWNSQFKESLIGYNLVYVDWSEGKKNPKILTKQDFSALINSNKLLARKVDSEGVSRELIQMLEDKI